MEYVLWIPGDGRSAIDWLLLSRPDVRFFCDLNFDPFLFMQEQKKVYGALDSPVDSIGRRLVNFASFRLHDFAVRIRSNDPDPMGCCKRCESSHRLTYRP